MTQTNKSIGPQIAANSPQIEYLPRHFRFIERCFSFLKFAICVFIQDAWARSLAAMSEGNAGARRTLHRKGRRTQKKRPGV